MTSELGDVTVPKGKGYVILLVAKTWANHDNLLQISSLPGNTLKLKATLNFDKITKNINLWEL
jgi:hypothetical protein